MNISIKGAALSVALTTALTAGAASAQDTIDLKISHAFPPTHYLIEHGLDIWVNGLKEDLGDRVDFTIYLS